MRRALAVVVSLTSAVTCVAPSYEIVDSIGDAGADGEAGESSGGSGGGGSGGKGGSGGSVTPPTGGDAGDDPGSGGTSGTTGGTTGKGGASSGGSSGKGGAGGNAGSMGGTTSGGTAGANGGSGGGVGGSAAGKGGTGGGGVLLFEDFEDGEANGWEFISVPWTVTNDGGNEILQLSSPGDVDTTWAIGGNVNWTDVRVEMRVKFVSGDGLILLSPRWRDANNYAFVEYTAMDRPKLRRRLAGSTADIITAANIITFALGQWHTVAVTLQGNDATLEFDGTVIGMGTDSTPVPNGGIAIAVENGIVAIDDVRVTVP